MVSYPKNITGKITETSKKDRKLSYSKNMDISPNKREILNAHFMLIFCKI
jgi:hypothetical protein